MANKGWNALKKMMADVTCCRLPKVTGQIPQPAAPGVFFGLNLIWDKLPGPYGLLDTRNGGLR